MMHSQDQKLLSTKSTSNPTKESALYAQRIVKNIGYSAALKRLRKVVPGIGSGFGAWQGYKEMEIFGQNVVNILENESYVSTNKCQIIEAEEITRSKCT